jgi:hypothetical protein
VADLLARQWEVSRERLTKRCEGLTDEELLWEPTPGCWNLFVDAGHPGGWSYPYDFDPPRPHPMTSIGWRLVHIAADNWVYMEHAFGPGERNFPDLEVHGTADEVLANWWASTESVSRWLRSATDGALKQLRPSPLGDPLSAGEVMRILIDEQTHHGAEVALLRDLYMRRV